MTKPSMHQPLPSWALSHEDNFQRFGLMAERDVNGQTTCNIHIIGGLAGQPVVPTWANDSNECLLLALSVVNRLFGHPDTINAVMAPFVTHKFKSMCQFTTLLPDGERVPAPYFNVAKRLMLKRMNSDACMDPNSLTIPIDALVKDLSLIVHTQFPD